MSKQGTAHNPHDTFFKKLMSDPQNVSDFISVFLPSEIANNIDLDTIKLKDREQLTKKRSTPPCGSVSKSNLRLTNVFYYACTGSLNYEAGTLLVPCARQKAWSRG